MGSMIPGLGGSDPLSDDTRLSLPLCGNLPAASETEGSVQVVEFLLGQDRYAINLFDLKEVVDYSRVTRLPNSPRSIRGIIDLRGEITTIIDLKEELSIPSHHAAPDEESRIIVLDTRLTGSKAGIMVDEVLAVSTYTPADIDTTATKEERGSHVLGIIRRKNRDHEMDAYQLVILLDIRGLLRAIESGQAKGS